MRIGVFGGAFNPPHYGHLLAADDVRRTLGLDRVLFVPTFHPPHKDSQLAPYEDRVAMTRLALKNRPGLELHPLEHKLPVPSYTVATLRHIRKENPGVSLYLIVGTDQYRDMATWHQPDSLDRHARIVVMDRPGAPRPSLFPGHRPSRVRFVPVVPVDISAALIRKRLAKRESVEYMLPATVGTCISRNRLYS
jgi:nicotinate-nucleotide adenylyltransferase